MDQYGGQDFNQDHLFNELGDFDSYRPKAPEDDFEAGILDLYGTGNREQSPGSTSASVPVSDPRNGSFDHTHFNNTKASHQLQQQQPLNINYMQNNQEMPTWLGYHPRHDSPPLQQPAPVFPNQYIDPIAAADPPPAAFSSSELIPLPLSLEDHPRASSSSFFNFFTGLSTAPVASPPRSTVAESRGNIPFSRVFPSVYVNDISHVFSGGSETAVAPPPAPRSTAAGSSEIPFSRVFPSINLDNISHVFTGGSETAEVAAAAPPPFAPPPRSTVAEPTMINFSSVFLSVDNISHVFSGGSETAGIITTQKDVAGVTSASAEQTVNIPDGASSSTGKSALPPVEDRKRKGKMEIVEVEDDPKPFTLQIRENGNTKRQAAEPPKAKRTRTAEMHNLAERRRRQRLNDNINNLYDLTWDSKKGTRSKDDKMDKSIEFLRALQHLNGLSWQQEQYYYEKAMSSPQPYGMMYGIYNYMPPAIPGTLPPPAAVGPSNMGAYQVPMYPPAVPVSMYPPAAAGPSMGSAFPAAPMYPPAVAGPNMRPAFMATMYPPAAAGPSMAPRFPVPIYPAPPVPLPVDPQSAFRHLQQMAPARPQNEAGQQGGSTSGLEETGNPGNHLTG